VDNSRADEIETIIDRAARAAGDGELRFYQKDLDELLHLLAGIEDSIIQAGTVDQHWRVPAERLEELPSSCRPWTSRLSARSIAKRTRSAK
jgi:hypothetical protein